MNIKHVLLAGRGCGTEGVRIRIASTTGIHWMKGAMKRMDRKEAAATLKAHAEDLKKSQQYFTNAKVMEAIGFAMAVLGTGCSEYEYAMFSWNIKTEKYEQMGRPMISEQLARDRFYEYVQKDWFNKCYDTSRSVMKRRTITVFASEWEELD